MIYAPVLIPTLNRIEHLKRCIVSLQNNSWAKYTPLIISVDYPPDSKYVDGYNKVCEYLKGGLSGFASVEIFYQEKNLGVFDNAKFVQDYAKKHYDRYIWTEDDNEMSPNFIEYIDKGLEIFQHDDRIVAICSNGVVDCYEDNSNIVLSHNFSAHGCGRWYDKDEKYQKEITRKNFLKIAKKSKNILKLCKYNYALVFTMQHAIYRDMDLYILPSGEIPIIDMIMKIYAVINDKYVVCPKLQKSRNWGYDGSGANCLVDEKTNPEDVVIDQRNEFSYHYTEPIEILRIIDKQPLEMKLRVLVAFVKLKMWVLFKRE